MFFSACLKVHNSFSEATEITLTMKFLNICFLLDHHARSIPKDVSECSFDCLIYRLAATSFSFCMGQLVFPQVTLGFCCVLSITDLLFGTVMFAEHCIIV